jgi:hypothetical protein
MIVQAVCLLDDLDKELNNYIMRCREWYGWHFPELGKIITDNIAFVKTVRIIGKSIVYWQCHSTRCAPGWAELPYFTPSPQIKKTPFRRYIDISALLDSPFSQNQSLNLADDRCSGLLNDKIQEEFENMCTFFSLFWLLLIFSIT